MTYRVIHWGVGGVGTAALHKTLETPGLQVVGARVYSLEKHGIDIGTLVGRPECGVTATKDVEAILSIDADVVIHTSRLHMTNDAQDDDIVRLLASGKNVISSTLGYHIPTYGEEVTRRYELACQSGESSFYGVGENPGFMFERLMPTLTTLCRDINLITFEEFIDLSQFQKPEMLMEVMGIGKPPLEMSEDTPTYNLYKRLFHEVLNGAARSMGISLERIDYRLDFGTVDEDLHLPVGTIKAGHVVAQRCTQTGFWRGQPFLKAVCIWSVKKCLPIWGLDRLQGWQEKDFWRLNVSGNPGLGVDINLLPPTHADTNNPVVTATAMACINAIPDVVAAPPGLVFPKIFAPWQSEFSSAWQTKPPIPAEIPPVTIRSSAE